MILVGWHRWRGFGNDLDMFDCALTCGFVTVVVHRQSLEWLNAVLKDGREAGLIAGRVRERLGNQLERLRRGGAV